MHCILPTHLLSSVPTCRPVAASVARWVVTPPLHTLQLHHVIPKHPQIPHPTHQINTHFSAVWTKGCCWAIPFFLSLFCTLTHTSVKHLIWWKEVARRAPRQLIWTSTASKGTAVEENDYITQEDLCGDGALHYIVYGTAAGQVGKQLLFFNFIYIKLCDTTCCCWKANLGLQRKNDEAV